MVQLSVLAATGVAFFMAVALPHAFQDRAALFGITYILLRIVGLGLYAWAASSDPAQRAAVRKFGTGAIGGMVAVLIGAFVGGPAQFWFWALAIVLDIVAAEIGGQAEGWNLHPDHFTERHGLFIIIALGETLVVAASNASDTLGTPGLLLTAILVVSLSSAFWWSYFPRMKPLLDRALQLSHGAERSKLARDAFSLLHFPMLCGIVAFAVSAEKALAHPDQPLDLVGRISLAASLVLFLGGMAIAVWRAARQVSWPRILLSLAAASAVILPDQINAAFPLGIALAFLILILITEQSRLGVIERPQAAEPPH
jgi:low temperature requirement protein LtrA